MSKPIPKDLEKLRDEWAFSEHSSKVCLDSFDAGALAMRTYMQAEMDKLIAEIDVTHYKRQDWIYSCPRSEEGPDNNGVRNECYCGADRRAAVIASHRAWKDKQS